ncbi:hypothetical protein P153DRAFT_341764 [Dothidotthia symphoricarpi CBS 119687]|uniref:T6SS Phospholipase effector Tle1-like catalytic domain-containing protein n=1 Tax=Dothidotthia symphoricarpi CBS 119687 TaxID=1392245 RepID=A0A6A6AC23_9PLEO|nr:uncharacterized protein P153DRAFT_341764 [Dothidotthia symphoricarpi CBS 119687]KAF2128261.1 hypothetical protein P153DRAFT_341764 [Dothidotthia symphoricarpi CBS 119687]
MSFYPTLRPKKRIVICCDGTWQSSAHGHHNVPSNVAKISRSIGNWYIDENELTAPQIVYYDAGVGTGMGWLDQKWAGGFGEGLDENVCEAYNFIVNNYTPGDELFFFGFSRGAYTVRACAGLVCRAGICTPSAMAQFWEMYANYKSCDPTKPMDESLWGQEWTGKPEQYTIKVKDHDKQFSKGAGFDWLSKAEKNVTIKVVGVWDTVGSLGYPDNMWVDVSARNKPYGFHNTNIHRQIENAFHALALEEHRQPFSPTLWSLPPGSKTNLIQCWFPGVHINVGGGSGDGLKPDSKGDLEVMSITTFFWMVDRCYPFLRFQVDPNIVSDYQNALNKLTEKSLKAKDAKGQAYGGWGIGPVVDSYAEEAYNKVIGSATRTPGHYFLNKVDDNPEHKDDPEHKNNLEHKDKPEHKDSHEHTHQQTNEYMHPVVHHAWEKSQDMPKALEGFTRTSRGPGKGNDWIKIYEPAQPGIIKRGWSYIRGTAAPSKSEQDLVSIPEFVIPAEGYSDKTNRYWQPWERKLVQHSLARVQGFIDQTERETRADLKNDVEGARFLAKLDEENKDVKELHLWKESEVTSSNPKYQLPDSGW